MASLFHRLLAFFGLAPAGEAWVYPSSAITRAVEAMLASVDAESTKIAPAPEEGAEAADGAEAPKQKRRRFRRADAA